MIVQFVMFKSGLSDQDIKRTVEERAPQYRALPGLLQKLYVQDPATGEFGAVYVWRDEESLRQFRDSELARTIPQAYPAQGEAHRRTLEMVSVLREDAVLKMA